MNSASLSDKPREKTTLLFAGVALLITFIFGYTDEGYYDLRWMNNLGNWIVLGIYALAMLIGQLVFFHILLKKYKGAGKTAISAVFGAFTGAAALMTFFYTSMG